MKIVFYSPESWKFPESVKSAGDVLINLNGNVQQLSKLVAAQRPEVILVGGFEVDDDLLNSIKVLVDALPQSVLVLCAPGMESESLLKAMRVGIREVCSGSSTEDFSTVIARAKEHFKVTPVDHSIHHGQRIGFISAKGGDGGTSVLANIAAALAQDEKNRVIVIDLSLGIGDVEIYLTNKPATNNLTSFTSSVDRLDATLLDLMTHHVSNNLHLIPAPSNLEDILRIKSDDVEKLIDILAAHYDFVLIDVGTGIDPISIRIWERLDKMILTATFSIPSARRASQLLQMWEGMGLSANKAFLLISRCGGPTALTLSAFEQAVGKKVWQMVYREFIGIQESLLHGVPVIELKPNSRFTHSILEVASSLNGKPIRRKFSLWAYFGIK